MRQFVSISNIEQKIALEPNTWCWLWTGATTRGGYGNLKVKQRVYRAHRHVYELYNGRIKKGLLVCHKCDTPACVNPDHLFLGTHSDNAKDCFNKNRRKARSRSKISSRLFCNYDHPLFGGNGYFDSELKRRCRICRTRDFKYKGKK